MKIGLLTSHRGQKQFEKEYRAIISHLQKRGHEVIHSMETTLEILEPLSYSEREEVFVAFYHILEDCDFIFVENSLQSTQLGFGLAYLREKGKPIVVLSVKDAPNDIRVKGEIFSNVENMMAYVYAFDTIAEILDEAIDYMQPRLDKRFTIIFPSHLLSKLEAVSRKKKLPKSVFIRQLIEEDLKHQEI